MMWWFWIDLISSFPYQRIVENQLQQEDDNLNIAQSAKLIKIVKFVRFIKVIRLLRLAKLKVIFDKIEEYLQLSPTIAGILSFLKLSVFVLFWAHWIGCIFHFIAQMEENPENWLIQAGIEEENQMVRYINSLYWAVTTMTTVGYGDMSPYTPLERTFGLVLLLIACAVFAFTMNSIGSALQQINMKQSEYRQKMSNISKYMKKAKIPNQLQNRVRRYLEYIWDIEKHLSLQDFIQPLSNDLKHTLLIEVNGNLISYCQILTENFSNELLLELTQVLDEETIFPQEFVFKEMEEEVQEKNLYFVQEGEIEIIIQRTEMVLAKKQKFDYFGEISFVTDQQRRASARSINFSNLFYLRRNKFLRILNKYQKDHEKFCKIKDCILLYQDFSLANIRCYSCQMDDHISINCPQLHYCVSASHYIATVQYYLQKQRKNFVRKDRIEFHALCHLGYINKRQRLIEPLIDQNQQEILKEEWNLSDIDEQDHDKIHRKISTMTSSESLFYSKFKQERKQRSKRKITFQIGEYEFEEEITESSSNSFLSINDRKQINNRNWIKSDTLIENNDDINFIEDIYILTHFELGQEFEQYFEHNNKMEIIEKANKKKEQRYQQEIEIFQFTPEVLELYLDFYKIDQRDILIEQYFKQRQNIKYYNFEQRLKIQQSRRVKKQQKQIKIVHKKVKYQSVLRQRLIYAVKCIMQQQKQQ